MTAITQTVVTPSEEEDGEETRTTTVAAHQDENGIYGVATDTKYGHVRLLSDPTAEDVSTGDTFSASAIKTLVGQMGSPGEFNWPDGTVPAIGTMLDSATFLITSGGTFTLPAGKYRVEVVGGGAAGQAASTPYPASLRPGAGGASASPVQDTVLLNTGASATATVGASGGNSVFTVAGKTITGPAGTGTGSAGGRPGATGLSYTHPGGSGGAYKDYSSESTAWMGSGGGGGSGSRLSRVITNVTGGSGGDVRLGEPHASYYGLGGSGGVGYGAGGGGGGTTNLGKNNNGVGGAGAPGCILITVFM